MSLCRLFLIVAAQFQVSRHQSLSVLSANIDLTMEINDLPFVFYTDDLVIHQVT